jgi:hypothetical protein
MKNKTPLNCPLIWMLLMVLMFGLSSQILAQESRGTIIGRVVDGSDASLPGVAVKATNLATNVVISAQTNESGGFNIPFLVPGKYRLTVESPSFKKYVKDGVEVRVAETVEINIQMQVGAISDTVETRADTAQLETANPSLGQVIDQQRVQELPIFSGNASELTLLAPGVVNATDMRLRKAAFNNAPSQIATDGNGTYNNDFTIDGVPNTFASGATARVAFSPPVNAVREFKIQSAAYDASVGHTIGALTNLSTNSGGAGLHGEAHLWERNAAFDAPNFFNNKNNTKLPVYQDHRYGASAGGPVVIPGLYNGRDKTFWYYAYEENRWGDATTFTGTVPTLKQRQGDFSELLALGSAYQIYDPFTTRPTTGGRFTRNPIPGNIIPANRLDPVGLKLINLYPVPNQPGTVNGTNNYFSASKALEKYYVHFARMDHTFNEKHRIFGRIHYDWWEENKNDHFLNRNNALFLNRINKGFAFDDVYVLDPKTVLNVRYGITYQTFPERRASQGTDLTTLGFSPALAGLVIDKALATLPRVSVAGYSGIAPWETGDGTNTGLIHAIAATVTRLQGRHNLKFGTDIRFYRAGGNRYPASTAPDLSFGTGFTQGPLDNSPASLIGQGLATMLLGIPGGSMAVSASYAAQDKFYGLFLHDDFKLTPKLTINVGLRYELETPFTERFDRLVAGFSFDQTSPLEAAARANYAKSPIAQLPVDQFRVRGGLNFVGANNPNGRSPYPGEKNNFLPRIGFAWQVGTKTVVRGGYGLYFDSLGVNTTQPIQTGFSQSTPIQASLDSGQTYIATLANPLPNGLLQPVGSAGGLLTNIGQSISFFDPNMKFPYAQRWSLGFQRELPMGFVGEMGYVANRGVRLPVARNYNVTPAQYLSTSPVRDQATINFLSEQFPNPFLGLNSIFGANITRANLLRPFPQFGDITVEEPIGYSWYHSMQARIERRFNQGFTFQLAYTWSKLMDATVFLNPTDPTPYESLGDLDRPNRIAASGVWEVPLGRGKHFGGDWPGVVNAVVGNWKIGGVMTLQSGAPLGFGNRIFTGDLDNIALPSDQRTAERWFNTDAGFNKVAAQQLASNIRTFPLRFGGVRSDNQSRWDFAISKTFPIKEQVKAMFRAEVFNAWNTTNFAGPNTDPTSNAFGTITGTAGGPRNWQFAFKLTF